MKKKLIIAAIILINLISFANILLYIIDSNYNLKIKKSYSLLESETNATLFQDLSDSNFSHKKVDKLVESLIGSGRSLNEIYGDLSQLERNGKISSGICHEISHSIGRHWYFKSSSIHNAFETDVYNLITDTNCATGYYHGVTIGFTEQGKDANEIRKELREMTKKYESQVYNPLTKQKDLIIHVDMIHGVGHAIFVKNNSIEASTKECNLMSDIPEVRDICKSGVYMEESFKKRAVDIESSMFDCEYEDDENKYACLVGNRSADKLLETRASELSQFCSHLKDDLHTYACYKNLFLQLGFQSKYKRISDLAPLCNPGTQNRKLICLESLHKTLVGYKLDAEKSKYYLCSYAGVLNYGKCVTYLSQRSHSEVIFMHLRGITF